MWDVVIVGAGVVGAMIARELSRFQIEVLLLEKEADVSCGASKANSGIVHGGFDDKQGTMKSKLVRLGNQAYEKLNEELNFGYLKCGSLVLAFNEMEVLHLEELLKNGQMNGIEHLEILNREAVLKMEPHVNKEVVAALYCPESGITSPYELVIALVENAIANGVALKLNEEVVDIKMQQPNLEVNERHYLVRTQKEQYRTRNIINCAGVYSDHIARMVGDDFFNIIPRRGEYVLLNKVQGKMVNRVLFQTPTAAGKGILVTRTYHGNLMLGPNAQEIDDKSDVSTNLEALSYIVETARKTVPDFDLKQQITSFSGIRATSDRKDFIIEESVSKGFFHVAGIESPGLTSSPAIAAYVIELMRKSGVQFNEKGRFNPNRLPIIQNKELPFDGSLSHEEPTKHIVCRCEKVTEAEILDALGRGIPIDSVDAIKRRTRAGMGPCQGHYCGPLVRACIAKYYNLPLESVTPGKKRGKLVSYEE